MSSVAGEIDRLSEHLKPLGPDAFLLVDGFVHDTMGDGLRASLEAGGVPHAIERFNGECCSEEIARVEALARARSAAVVVGIGGGKTIDTAKVVACATGARLAIVPTIASTDAPCSAVAVRYTPNGVYQEAISLPRNPDIVVVDSAVVAKAPARFLIAGVGDALSTWFEARSNVETNSRNYIASGFPTPAAGLALARACYDVILTGRARRQIRGRARRADPGGREHHRSQHAAERPRIRELRRLRGPRHP